MHKLTWLFLFALLAVGLVAPALADALPANPWTGGRWQGQDLTTNVITLTQTGSQISGTGPCPGTTGSDVTYSATASADNTTASFAYTSSVCTGVGGTFSGTLAASGLAVSGSGVTQFGTGFSFSWTYLGGGTEPRRPRLRRPRPRLRPRAVRLPRAPGPATGSWTAAAVLEIVQSGGSVTGVLSGGESNLAFSGTASGKHAHRHGHRRHPKHPGEREPDSARPPSPAPWA